jgi:hypothetical protein
MSGAPEEPDQQQGSEPNLVETVQIKPKIVDGFHEGVGYLAHFFILPGVLKNGIPGLAWFHFKKRTGGTS